MSARLTPVANGWPGKAAQSGFASIFIALLGLASTTNALAQTDPFAALTSERSRDASADVIPSGDVVQRYVTAAQGRVFLFERYGDEARIKFLCADGDEDIGCRIDEEVPAEEIHLLSANRASRGDTIFKNEAGGTVLRLTSYGGSTVYLPGDKTGRAASKSFGDDPSLSLLPVGEETVARRLQNATALVSAAVGSPIIFEAPAPIADEVADHAVLADAIVRTAEGLAAATEGRKAGLTIKRVVFSADENARTGVDKDGTLRVRYEPSRDILGRPSSSDIAALAVQAES
ncbi:MAG: DUF4908 domain-containing protein [Pseudomonadota bacterium]